MQGHYYTGAQIPDARSPFKMGLIGFPETSVTNHQSTLRNIPEFFLDCLTLEDGTNGLSRNVSNYQSTLRNIPEERRSQILH
jgi:hypothetical protein